jgi:tRNA-specific 2-thiouridylase
MKKQKTVFVGLSGGVDSSVAALHLINEGYNVVGVFIKVWHPDFMVCNWEAERLDAMRVAAHLGIPFLTCDAEAEYRDEVAKYFISQYEKGLTPNPDVMCNQHVKFGKFLRFALEKGADYIATGHYVQRKDASSKKAEMHRGIDQNKDQSYFLWSLTQDQLDRALFPVGNIKKEQVRKEAVAAGLPTAIKKDSQGICFLGHIDIPDFLSHYIKLIPGHVLNETGEVIGEHKGSLVYTIGQRHGFTITTSETDRQALFVSSKDIANNTITVSSQTPLVHEQEHIILKEVVLRNKLTSEDKVEVQFRYRQKPIQAVVRARDNQELQITILEQSDKPASGQSCVLYRGSHCLGGGIIQ